MGDNKNSEARWGNTSQLLRDLGSRIGIRLEPAWVLRWIPGHSVLCRKTPSQEEKEEEEEDKKVAGSM